MQGSVACGRQDGHRCTQVAKGEGALRNADLSHSSEQPWFSLTRIISAPYNGFDFLWRKDAHICSWDVAPMAPFRGHPHFGAHEWPPCHMRQA